MRNIYKFAQKSKRTVSALFRSVCVIELFLIVFYLLIHSSCGIPTFNPPPGQPNLRKTGTDIFINIAPTNLEITQGLVILYKLYDADDTGNNYAAEFPSITSYINGNIAYTDLLSRGYRQVLITGETSHTPTIEFSDLPFLFTDLLFEAGFVSDELEDYIRLDAGVGILQIEVVDSDGPNLAPKSLTRNDGEDNEITGVDFTSFDSSDANQNDLPVTDPPGILDRVELNFAVFGYRSTFGEGITYSLPGLLAVSDVIAKFTLSLYR
jgi:hypothetical protein